jgi:ADP-ribose pyrophosphatase
MDDADDRGYEILGREVPYQGFFRMERVRFRHRLFGGGWSRELVREVFERGHAAGVLLWDPDRDEVVLIEQFRVAAVDAPAGPWQLEIVAGIIEGDEPAEEVVRREAVEEAGCEVTDLRFVCEYLASPGGSSERVSVFVGRVDATRVETSVARGLEHEGEDIRVHLLPFAEAMRRVEDGGIPNVLALIALQWLALHRDELRAAWARR